MGRNLIYACPLREICYLTLNPTSPSTDDTHKLNIGDKPYQILFVLIKTRTVHKKNSYKLKLEKYIQNNYNINNNIRLTE